VENEGKMAQLKNKTLFFTTSPRTPSKMIPEIKLLVENFSNQEWNKDTQIQFATKLEEADFFEGKTSQTDTAFSARDRITRAPKALGFINLSPRIEITNAGNELITSKYPQEIFLRQLLKFQLPSPYHKETVQVRNIFFVKPYLELMRLIKELDYLTFDEVKIFALQLTDYREYGAIKNKILKFRQNKKEYTGKYKKFMRTTWDNEIANVFAEEINSGNTKTRESTDSSLKNFLKTKRGTLRDYTDAAFRYLRYTGLFSITGKGKISCFDNKMPEVDFILTSIDRSPIYCDDENNYKTYLFDNKLPILYVDNKNNIINIILRTSDDYTRSALMDKSTDELKVLREEIILSKKEAIINTQITLLKEKSFALYSEVVDTYNEILSDDLYDAPLMMEWNTWRAMTMIDSGTIKGNFQVDDIGQPMSTAQGNMPDIECDYGDFTLAVEVTLQSGQRQYEAEGEPVSRHYGRLKKQVGKETFCLFIAPTVNNATLAHFFSLNKTNISYYGGKSNIIPLHLEQFMKLVDNSYNYKSYPNPNDIYSLLQSIISTVEKSIDENDWFEKIRDIVNNWLN
jgi:hypothetical protein